MFSLPEANQHCVAHAQKAKLSYSLAAEWLHPCCLLERPQACRTFLCKSWPQPKPCCCQWFSDMNGCGTALGCDPLTVLEGMQSKFLWFLPALCKDSKTLDNTVLATLQKMWLKISNILNSLFLACFCHCCSLPLGHAGLGFSLKMWEVRFGFGGNTRTYTGTCLQWCY